MNNSTEFSSTTDNFIKDFLIHVAENSRLTLEQFEEVIEKLKDLLKAQEAYADNMEDALRKAIDEQIKSSNILRKFASDDDKTKGLSRDSAVHTIIRKILLELVGSKPELFRTSGDTDAIKAINELREEIKKLNEINDLKNKAGALVAGMFGPPGGNQNQNQNNMFKNLFNIFQKPNADDEDRKSNKILGGIANFFTGRNFLGKLGATILGALLDNKLLKGGLKDLLMLGVLVISSIVKKHLGGVAGAVTFIAGTLLPSILTFLIGLRAFSWGWSKISKLAKGTKVGKEAYDTIKITQTAGNIKTANNVIDLAKGTSVVNTAGDIKTLNNAIDLTKGASDIKKTGLLASLFGGLGSLKFLEKFAGKEIGKIIGKKIPYLGLGLGALLAAQRASANDFVGAAGELASGGLSLLPGAGTLGSLGIDAWLWKRDKARESGKWKPTDDLRDILSILPVAGPLNASGIFNPFGMDAIKLGSTARSKAEDYIKQIEKNTSKSEKHLDTIKKEGGFGEWIKNVTDTVKSWFNKDKSDGSSNFKVAQYTAGSVTGSTLSASSSKAFGAKGSAFTFSSPYGMRKLKSEQTARMHWGEDYSAAEGTPIPAQVGGKVIKAVTEGYGGGYGKHVILQTGKGESMLYAHMSEVAVSVGDTVKAGDIIGKVGHTGHSEGDHVHYEAIVNGKHVKPSDYVAQKRQAQSDSEQNYQSKAPTEEELNKKYSSPNPNISSTQGTEQTANTLICMSVVDNCSPGRSMKYGSIGLDIEVS